VSFLGGNGLPTDTGPDASPVTTPDQKALGKSRAQGQIAGGWAGNFWAVFASLPAEILKAAITLTAAAFDEILSLIVPFLTASQGEQTDGFYNLVAGLLNDLLGVEVAGSDLSAAQNDRGRIGAMQQVGGDLFTALANEFIGNQPDAGEGGGPGGLPGTPGQPLTPDQGVKAAKAFIGFLLSFSVRQGNVAVLSDALSWHILGQIREYGEMMAKNLGLSRLGRRALQPFVQTLIATPLQQALNQQYRPHVMDSKQLASAFLRGEIDASDYRRRLTLQGFTDGDIQLLLSDTYTRIPLEDAFLLHENGVLTDSDFQARVAALGFNSSDIGLIVQARQYAAVQGADRAYAKEITTQLANGVITATDYQTAFDALRIPKLEKDALTRNANALLAHHRKQLSLGFLKRAYLDASISLDEYIAHALAMGYSQDDVDLLEIELLFDQKKQAATAAAKAAAAAKKAAGKATTPTTPPATGQ
jgi:hypothetical protein